MSEGAVKVAVHRLRRRYRAVLREEIAQTVTGVERDCGRNPLPFIVLVVSYPLSGRERVRVRAFWAFFVTFFPICLRKYWRQPFTAQ